MKSIFKKESLIMTLVLIFYGFIAGGSLEYDSARVVLAIVVILVIGIGLVFYFDNKNKEKRLNLKREFESQEIDFDLSDKLGDDRIGLYFDKKKEKALLISMSSYGIQKYYVDDFEKSREKHLFCNYCIIDDKREKALLVQSYGETPKYEVVDYGVNNLNKNVNINNTIESLFLTPNTLAGFVLVEEKYGFVNIFYNCFAKSFNYIDKDEIVLKQGDTPYVVTREINTYLFLMDDFFNVLIIISSQFPQLYKVIEYSNIINVTYEEDGNTLFSKSMARTVGGALVGNALMGGAGAIVGGLSGDTSRVRTIQSMNIKILVRNTATPCINLPINRRGEVFNTKDETSKKNYQSRIREANAIKDLISVIIDNSSQQSTMKPTSSSQKNKEPIPQTGIADELVKLAQLKDVGVLSEEEFQQQKKKILS